jgi:acyl-CoA synthetase (AMP-forming)/AMP-acid ligase II
VAAGAKDTAVEAGWVANPEGLASLPDLLDVATSRFPDREYLRFPHLDISFTFAEVRTLSLGVAKWLHEHDVRQGDRVAVMIENVPAWPVSWQAILRLGAICVPISVSYKRADVHHVIRDSGAKIVLTSAAHLDTVRRAVQECSHYCIVFDINEALNAPGDGSEQPLPTSPLRRETIANFQYTSGTTGFPKACILTHDYWLRTAIAVAEAVGLRHDDTAIMSQAWSYVDQQWMSVMCLLTASPHVILERFSASGYWPAMRANKATVTYILGAMPVLLSKQPPRGDDLDNDVRVVLCSLIPKDRHRELEERWGAPWREVYGSTETGVDLIARVEDTATVGTGGLGRSPVGKTVKVVDDHGIEQPVGVEGEIVVDGLPMMVGYWNQPKATASVLAHGRYRSGDRGLVDDAGYIRHTGRIKDMIRRGGENIAAGEVEAVLAKHPAVMTVAVIGIADEIFDEIPKAYVVLVPGYEANHETARHIIEYCYDELAAFKVPTVLEFAQVLPMTPSQRVEKRKLLTAKTDHKRGCYVYNR